MTRFSVLSLLTLVITATAHSGPAHAPLAGPCADAVVVGNATVQVGDAQVLVSSFSCPSEEQKRAAGTFAARTAPRDVCGEQCTNLVCLNIGTAPTDSDCAVIADAIEILSADLGRTYLLNSTNGYYKQLVFGTCLTYIGVSAEEDTEACWSDWSSIIGQMLTTCPGSPNIGCTSIPPDLPGIADFSIGIQHS
ncbi:hypothetical protein K438DRAFT_1797265 [Mycena galopus ATCC 62051]|nr:hypothetical protein K438DRAFT_1797265 [Mycena galopus ATCC 62051]